VVVIGRTELRDIRESPSRSLFTGRRLAEVASAVPALPGLAADSGTLVDLEYADRLSDTFDNAAQLEVWLNRSAPSDVDARLRERGVTTISEETIIERTARYRASGTALGEAMRLGAGVAGVVLTALALLVIAATDRRRRVGELEALRHQGVPAAQARQALGGFGAVVAGAVPVGIAAGIVAAALGGVSGSIVIVSAVVVLGTAMLAGAAAVAGRRTS
jgi:hypothetical protein